MLKKIQNLPESGRKIILWMTMAIILAGLVFAFVKISQNRFKNSSFESFKQSINFPDLGGEINKFTENISTIIEGINTTTEATTSLENSSSAINATSTN